ncbi:intein C-terminal splicing region/intein N-terminal splicing region [Microbispora rosea]|uniref:Intein C-terminal splicing region/intein N-terminal splicing region n=2 Tax=Microbispora rosea TaxID=58117 RepID=A0A1N6VCL3_9ACTN|nr:hypothetical protein Mro03_20350 [Microbispora rosea subsp. rosea]SIQ75582.1 intein C-terminal splicing region/intein N-terminal splicing region [Microbispora rosea]
MVVIHAAWNGGKLVLWAEETTGAEPAASRAEVRPHPFAVPPSALAGELPRWGDAAAEAAGKAVSGDAVLLLPSSAASPLPSPETGLRVTARRPRISPWRVPALLVEPGPALRLLTEEFEPPPIAGPSLRYLAVVAAHARDLVRRGRVLPQLAAEDGGYAARWRPVLTGAHADRFRELAAAMPPVCRAVVRERPSTHVLTEALAGLADAAVRQALPERLLGGHRPGTRSPLADRWTVALTGDTAALPGARREEAQALARPLEEWFRAAHQLDGPVKVCFRLVEPLPAEDPAQAVSAPHVGAAAEAGAGAWRVEFALQSAEDPSLYVPAPLVWAGDGLPGLPGRPDETLLAGLGRAARLYPRIDDALREPRPTNVGLDVEGAFHFLRHAAPLLQSAGFGVQLPAWAGRTRLGLKLTTRSRSGPGAAADQGFGLAQLVDFRAELAVGDETISEAELAELARLKVPLVRLRGQWVELDARQLGAALRAVERRGSGQMTIGEVIQEVVHGGDDELPLMEVDADGLLGDLLSGEADRRLEPVATPAAFHGTLRPYQERGLAWLDFMSQIGLGGILADDMGLGKCLMPDSPIFVNGALTSAADIWQNYAVGILFKDGGEWATPLSPLSTNAIDAEGRVVQASFTRLYRQHVWERLRRVRLDDGSEITITRRHRLLGVNGWTRNIQPGDRICVPRRIRWEGEPVDPDLTVLLAWQISEGHESRKADLRITQKNRAVLDELHERILRIGTRYGLFVNNPTIRPTRDVHDLRLCSVDYAAFLSARGYEWGRLSDAKRIPDFIMAAGDDTVRLFLREFFTAEGGVVAGMRMIEIASASRWLMSQLSIMLRRFGIWLRTAEKMEAATNGSGIRRPYQIGMIGGPGLRLFRDLIGFSDPVKQAKLDDLCAKPANSNVEGVPGSDLLALARASTGLPMRHFGVGPVYFTGTQELSPKTAAMAIQAMDRMLSGAAEREHLIQPENRWTGKVAAAYRALDRDALRAIRDELAVRAEREVFYARVVSVEEVDYEGYVYDFEVAEHHNFVAGGILCHNTAQTLSLLLNEREQEERAGATLLVCPMSLLSNWQKEAARFAPSLDVYLHHGTGRLRGEELAGRVGEADLVLTTYGTALRDRDALARFTWARVVCDEAQAVKNAAARQAQAVRSLPARTRLALTGTPVENHLAELWSIMEFCNPGLLGSAKAFRDRYQEPIERRGDEAATAALKRATGPFVLRRLKTDKAIISDLPDKMEMKVWCTLTPEQASLYQAVVEDMMDRIAGSEGIERRGNVLAAMTRLKQVCNHPAHLLKDGSRLSGRSGKLARLEELAEEILSEGDKALVFTQYAEFGSMLQPYLAARLDRPVLWLHGGLPKKSRDALVERFQTENEPMIFLLSLKAAGTGLNLTAANHVVHVDRWWNPAVENQATDRAFRIGQTRNVQVRKFICAGTLEERIDEMIERKKALAESVVGTGEDWISALSTAELRELFRLSPEAVR